MRTVSKRIIVVDEVNEFLEREKTLLSREEFRLLTVTSGSEALFWARNDEPDLMILNFYMPDLNGYQVCRMLKDDSSTKNIPVIILAAHGSEDEEPANVTEAAGCDGCIEKPIQPDAIVPVVEELLGIPPRSHLRKESNLPCSVTDEDGRRDGIIRNITPAGLCLETAPAPWPGDIVTVELHLDDAPATIQAAVRWSREAGESGPGTAGCEFLEAPEELVKWVEGES